MPGDEANPSTSDRRLYLQLTWGLQAILVLALALFIWQRNWETSS